MKKKIVLLLTLLLSHWSCTDLDTQVYEQKADFWNTPEEVEGGVASAYTWLRNYAPTPFIWVYMLNEVTTDEIIVPTRGIDWYDGGIWEELWKHTWTPTSPGIGDAWMFVFTGISRVNSILESLKTVDPAIADVPRLTAEMRTLRAFYHYVGMELFGNIPVVREGPIQLSELGNTTDGSLQGNNKDQVFAFIEDELLQSRDHLSKEVSGETYGLATYWFAEALLAKLYLNAEVYTGTPRWSDCIAACDSVLASDAFRLEENFFSNFAINNHLSAENIFSIPFDANGGLHYFLIQSLTLHYASALTFNLNAPAFNGLCSTQEFVDLFNKADVRKKMFLIGQQYTGSKQYEDVVADPARAQFLKDGTPLDFDPVITTFSIQPPKTEVAGARCAKWEFNVDTGPFGTMDNDFAVYRLADVILMKAEAQLRAGNATEALSTLNKRYGTASIRSRVNMPDFTSEEMTLENLLKERARELAWEGHRRSDLIRFGTYLDARIPEKEVSENYRLLFPIPQAELAKNIYLKQNPGY